MAKKQKSKREMDKMCARCEQAQTLNNSDKMLCSVKGVVAGDFCCKKFIYDPLKRNPSPPVRLPKVDPKDLVL